MGSKTRAPQESDYVAPQVEKTATAIAKADSDYFTKNYDPLLQQMRDKAASEDVGSTLRGRAAADTQQALTSNFDLGTVQNINAGAERALAATGQMLAANTAAKNVKTEEQLNVLGTARGQEANTGDALAQSARMAASTDLNRVKNEQAVRRARRGALMQIASSAGSKMLANKGTTGEFFTSESPNITSDDSGRQYKQQFNLFGKYNNKAPTMLNGEPLDDFDPSRRYLSKT
jgi:hypothetical protein|tara:strand:+ start:4150 stop:4845 length:696 start_codon:yes stop_codon:yes gene_type:complete